MPELNNIAGMGVQQQTKNDCWFAAYLMVENYHKPQKDTYASEKQRVESLQEYQDFKTFYNVNDPFTAGASEELIEILLQTQGLRYQSLRGPDITPQAVEQAIAADHPVILGLNRGLRSGHFVVAYKIDNGIVSYINPTNPTIYHAEPMANMKLGSIMVP